MICLKRLFSYLDGNLFLISTKTFITISHFSPQDLLYVISNLITATNSRIYSSSEVWSSGRNVTLQEDFNTDFLKIRPEIESQVQNYEFVDILLEESHRRTMMSSLVPMLEKVLVASLKTMMVDEEGIDLVIDGMEVGACFPLLGVFIYSFWLCLLVKIQLFLEN